MNSRDILPAILTLVLFAVTACGRADIFSGTGSSLEPAGPNFAVSSPTSNSVVTGLSTLTGTCDDGATLTVSGDVKTPGQSAVCTGGTFSIPLQLSFVSGSHDVILEGTLPSGGKTVVHHNLELPALTRRGAHLFWPMGNYYGQYNWPADQPNMRWDLDYYKARGINVIRIGIGWEYLQPTLNGALTTWVTDGLRFALDEAQARHMKVLLDLHNYGRYLINNNGGQDGSGATDILGSTALPFTALVDVWTKLATLYSGHPALYGYGLMNEPHDMLNATDWPTAAQLTVNGIRTVDTVTPILIGGDDWSNAQRWPSSNGSLAISDPSNQIIYEAHAYFDPYGAGQYTATYDQDNGYPEMGVDIIKPFVDWLEAHHFKGIIGESNVPGDDPRWITVLEKALDYTAAHGVDFVGFSSGYLWHLFGHDTAWFNFAPLGGETMPASPTDRPVMEAWKKYPSHFE